MLVSALLGLALTQLFHSVVPSRELRTLRTVQQQIAPFVEIAAQRYPDLAANDALGRLALEIQEVRDLASRDIARDPSQTVLEATTAALSGWRNAFPGIKVCIRTLNTDRPNVLSVRDDLTRILAMAGIEVEQGSQSNSTPGRAAPIKIQVHPDNQQAADAFLSALSSYLGGGSTVSANPSVSPRVLFMTLNGWPKFLAGGQVQIE